MIKMHFYAIFLFILPQGSWTKYFVKPKKILILVFSQSEAILRMFGCLHHIIHSLDIFFA